MAYLVGNFDESGKSDKDIVTFAGFLADPYAWEYFNNAWRGLLRGHGLRVFKSEKALRFASPFAPKLAAKGVESRVSAIQKYTSVIHQHVQFGVACAVDAKAFRTLGREHQKRLGDPHYVAFRYVIGAIRDYLGTDDTVRLLCDDEHRYSVECYKIYTGIRQQDNRIRRQFSSIGFGDDYHFPELQSADLFAGLLRKEAEAEFLGISFPLHAVFDDLLAPPSASRLSVTADFYGADELAKLAG
jgi:hypothetical protein